MVRRGPVRTAVYTLLRTDADSAHAMDGRCHNGRTTHVPHPEIPAACSHPYPRHTRSTSSNSCSTNRETPPSDLPPDAGSRPSSRTINQARHRHGMHEQHRRRTHTHQHAHTTSPHDPTPPSLHRYCQLPATACPLCVCQRLQQTALPCNPHHWVCLGAAHRLIHCLHCGNLNSHHGTQPAAPPEPSPASHPSFFVPLTDALGYYLGGHYVADPVDHAWSIAMATGNAPLPPLRPPLRHSGGGLNVAARQILLALYLQQSGLHLRDPQLPAPRAAAPAPEPRAETAPMEVADLLPVQHRLRPAERNTLPTQRTPVPGTAPPSHTAEAPGELGIFSGRPPGRP